MFLPHNNLRVGGFVLGLALFGLSCDGGLAPANNDSPAILSGTIMYSGTWPDVSEVQDLRFVALRFVPEDTADFLQLNRLEASNSLRYGVQSDTFVIRNIEPGLFPFNGVARRKTADLLSWSPLGLYLANDGIIELDAGDSIHVEMMVDLDNPPDFP
ncbi:MAG: hypothetical protein HKN43_00775 [Rhodothermales bacterium]|nr:hypothetical protein [Rhodothermales bacterium]